MSRARLLEGARVYAVDDRRLVVVVPIATGGAALSVGDVNLGQLDDGPSYAVRCSCPAADFGRQCKHVTAALELEVSS